MTKEFLKMIELMRFAVFGKSCQSETDADLEGVCALAVKQGVLPLVFGSLEKDEKAKLSPKWENMFFRAMIANEQKMAALSGVVKKLEKENIPYCILKGSTVAKEYHLSECRLSGDVDLYVEPSYEQAASELFKSMGMEVEARIEGKQDFKASSPMAGLIEVHVQLYGENFRRVVLKDMFGITEPFVSTKINEFLTVNALGVNDTLEFLTTHFIKHFVREGSGIRQVTDLLAFVNNHKNEIDFDKFFCKLDKLKFKELILNVFGIGVKYFGLDIEHYSLEMADVLLDDIEEGENFGFGDAERIGLYERFLKSRTREDAEASKELVARKRSNIIKSVFLPGRAVLIKKGYTYLEKSVLFYPVAYVHRLCDVALNMLSGKRRYKKAMGFGETDNEAIRKRLKMMKDLHILN